MSQEKNKVSKKLLFVGISVVIILLGIFVIISFQKRSGPTSYNIAAQATAPLEKELVDSGARKVCDGGDNGRGSDNRSPYYRAYMELNKPTLEAATLMDSAASHSGYKLTHASPTNRGFLGAVADAYIDKWYFDDTSKQSPYNELKFGYIRLATVVEVAGSENPCNSNTKVPEGHTIIGIEARLPDYR